MAGECTTCGYDASLTPISKELAEEVVVKFGDKVVLTGAEFEQNVDLLMQSQAGIKDIIACMSPEQRAQVFDNILEGLINERVISEWISNQGLDRTHEYKEQARRAHEAVDRDLAIRAFEREVVKNIVFSDDEAKNWYDKNRERLLSQPFLESLGGVKARGFSVNTEKEAKDFAARAGTTESDFTKIAQEAKRSVTNFGLVTAQSSSVEPQIRTKILAMKIFPATEVIRGGDNKYWVVQGFAKVEPTFCPFPQVKDAVKERMKEERAMDYLRKKVDEIRAQSRITVNKDYLKKRDEALTQQMTPAMPVQAPATPPAPSAAMASSGSAPKAA